MATVFERYGGFSKVRKIVSDFYDRLLNDSELEKYFLDIDMARLIDHQAKFVSTIMGGPASIANEQIRRAHAPLGISSADFKKVTALLEETLEDHGLELEDIALVMSEVKAREAFVVTRS